MFRRSFSLLYFLWSPRFRSLQPNLLTSYGAGYSEQRLWREKVVVLFPLPNEHVLLLCCYFEQQQFKTSRDLIKTDEQAPTGM